MQVEELFDLPKELKEKYPLATCLISEIKEISSDGDFLTEEEFLSRIEGSLLNFEEASIVSYLRLIMLGDVPFPLPNELGDWSEEDFDKIHKRYRKLKRIRRICG